MTDPVTATETEGVKTLLGDPKKALIKLAVPMMLAMSIQTIYNVVDALWVSGLGPEALAAVGFFFPFFWMAMAIATGLGTGGGAAISRRIGARDKAGADSVGTHTFVLMTIAALAFTLPFFVLARHIFTGLGAEGVVIGWATDYARVLFAGSIVIFFSNIANGVLRAEGDVRRAMWAMMLGGVINIILDPLFIYTFGMGVVGAAYATLTSLSISAALLFYWLFVKKDSYVDFRFRGFKWDRSILQDIFRVGLPAMVQQVSMSFNAVILNYIVVLVAVNGNDGVAILGTGWRVSTFGILPLLGIATAMVSLGGSIYGQRNARKLKIAFDHAVKVGLAISLCGMLAVYLLAPYITVVFTQGEGSERIADELTNYFRITCLFFPAVSFGMLSSSMFQGTGDGMKALAVTLLRTTILTSFFAVFLAIWLNWGLTGVWWSIVVANSTASAIAYAWAKRSIRGYARKFRQQRRRERKTKA